MKCSQSPIAPPPIQQPNPPQQNVAPPYGTDIAAYQKPSKPKKPIYKKWWFYAVIVIIFIVAISGISNGNKSVKIDWNELTLSNQLPTPPKNKGKIHENSSDELWVDINNITDNQYTNYVEACKEKGFTVDVESNSFTYGAYNTEGYKLSLSYYGSKDDMGIKLVSPIEMTTITWPTSNAGNQLPVPKSKIGKFSHEYDDNFFVYIGDTSKEDYNDYVKACSDKGFTVDYNKGDDYYYADNSEGWHISLKYEGNNIMSIDIRVSSKKSTGNTTESTTSLSKLAETEPNDVNLADGMRKDFKEAMDSYEEFMDQYVAFMKKYSANPNDVGLLTDYANYMSKYADMCDKFNKWESENMNDAETAYYIDVQARVSKKLLEVAN